MGVLTMPSLRVQIPGRGHTVYHLYKKITGTQAFGEPMPSIGPPLDAGELMIVETWILGGALE